MFQLNCIQFFDSLIDLQATINQDYANKINYNVGISMYTGTGILPGREQLIENLYNKYDTNTTVVSINEMLKNDLIKICKYILTLRD